MTRNEWVFAIVCSTLGAIIIALIILAPNAGA